MNMKDDILKLVKLENRKVLILRKPTEEDSEAMIEYLNIVGGESDNLLFGKNELDLLWSRKESILKI